MLLSGIFSQTDVCVSSSSHERNPPPGGFLFARTPATLVHRTRGVVMP